MLLLKIKYWVNLPLLESAFKDTWCCIIKKPVKRSACILAGYSFRRADLFKRAMGKRAVNGGTEWKLTNSSHEMDCLKKLYGDVRLQIDGLPCGPQVLS